MVPGNALMRSLRSADNVSREIKHGKTRLVVVIP